MKPFIYWKSLTHWLLYSSYCLIHLKINQRKGKQLNPTFFLSIDYLWTYVQVSWRIRHPKEKMNKKLAENQIIGPVSIEVLTWPFIWFYWNHDLSCNLAKLFSHSPTLPIKLCTRRVTLFASERTFSSITMEKYWQSCLYV